MSFKFENLTVFHYALEVNDHVCALIKTFPEDESLFLASQMKKAADAVVLNITEGSTLPTNAEFRQLLAAANRSALEIIACLYLARNRKYIDEETFKKFYDKIEKLVAMIQAISNSIK